MIAISIVCDGCGTVAFPRSERIRAHLLRAIARKAGWRVGVTGPGWTAGPRDYCPACVAEASKRGRDALR